MLKKRLCIVVILAILLTFSACGRKQPPAGDIPQTQAILSQTETISPLDETITANPTEIQPTETVLQSTETQPAETVPQSTETQPAETVPQSTEAKPTVPPETRPAPQQQTQPTTPPEETQPAQPEPSQPPIPPLVETPTPTYGHTALAKTEYYQYSIMTGSERQLYNKLVTAIENLQSEVAVTGMTIQADAGLALFHRVLADNPQFFWVSRTASVTYDPRTQNVRSFVLLYTDGEKADTVNNTTGPVVVADRALV